MSAFIVSNETINRVVHGMTTDAMGCPRGMSCEAMDALGRRLHAMNAHAVEARYREPCDAITDYQYRSKNYSKCEMLKAMNCLRYQCTEGNIPETALYDELCRAIEKLNAAIVDSLPEYESAPWDA